VLFRFRVRERSAAVYRLDRERYRLDREAQRGDNLWSLYPFVLKLSFLCYMMMFSYMMCE
jgi:hypothetical protein